MVVSSVSTNVVKVGPHLDVRNVAHVRVTVHQAVESGSGDVAVDMSDVALIDAAGLGMLTAAHLRAERAGLRLVRRDCSKGLRRVLAVTRLNRLLHIEPRLPLSA